MAASVSHCPWEDAETLTRVAMEVFEGLPQADRIAQISEGASVAHAMKQSGASVM
jgi:hypothetical protein